MTDLELESKLKTVRVPERSADYWEDFPSQVRVQLRPVFNQPPRSRVWPRLAWSGGLAFACALFAFVIFPAINVLSKNERTIRRELAELPHHLRAFMADEHGLHYLIADQQ